MGRRSWAESRVKQMYQLEGAVAAGLWLTAVPLECQADVVTASSLSKEAREQDFKMHFPMYEY